MPGPGQPTELFGHPSKVVQDTWAIVQRLEEDRGLHQIVNVADHVTHGHDLSRLVARCLISSSYVVLKMPGMTYRQQGPDEHLAGLKDGWDTSAQQTTLEQMVLNERLHENEFCVVLPASMRVSAEIAGGDALDGEFARADDVNGAIGRLESRVYSVPVGADYPTVRRLLKQDAKNPTAEPHSTGILMPDIRNLSLQDLTKLRKDYDDGFARMRHSLKKCLKGMAQADGESKFAGVIEEIDDECRKVEEEFNRIKKKHSRSLGGMLVTSSLVGVAAVGELLLPGVFTAATTALGSVKLADLVSKRVATKDSVEDLEKNAYWIAWKIHQQNRSRSAAGD
jgi:hypothetical protein